MILDLRIARVGAAVAAATLLLASASAQSSAPIHRTSGGGLVPVSPNGGIAAGGVVYDNGNTDPLTDSGNEMTSWVQADDFELSSATSLGGASVDWFDLNFGNEWDGGIHWYIFADAGGTPGALIDSGTGIELNTVLIGTTNGWDWWTTEFDFDHTVALAANTRYWFGLHWAADFDFIRDDVYFAYSDQQSFSFSQESFNALFNNWAQVTNEDRGFRLLEAGGPGGQGYVAAVWSTNSIHTLDAGMNSTGSFAAGSTLPNGVTSDGSLIWSLHFTTAEVIAYNLAGVQQFSWPAGGGLQGLTYVSSKEMALFQGGQVDFYHPMTGAFVRTIPAAEGGTIEGLCWDGNSLWQLGTNGLYETNVNTGAIINTFPNAAGVCSFGGTGIANASATELMLACTSGDWYRVRKSDGGVNASGNNGLDMYGLGFLGAGAPCPDLVYCDGNPVNAADLTIDNCVCAAGSANLVLSNAPAVQFGYPIVGSANGVVTNPPGAQGDLCLVGATIGRYASDALFTDGSGNASVDVLNAVSGGGGGNIPTIGGNLCNPPSQTWNFQWWHRDGMNPSKFSKAIQVTFQ